jgi:uncharacterized Zn-finger protein
VSNLGEQNALLKLQESTPGTTIVRLFRPRLLCRLGLLAFSLKVKLMADHVVPHFHNDAGVAVIEIGSQEFMCVGANPPFDHPHVFLDLGNDNEIICPYCSTLYRFAADLAAGEARPPECVLKDIA